MRLLGWPLGHERQRELLAAYLDAQLAPREQRDLERHLESCAACRAELDGLRATVALLRAAPPVSLRRSFTLTPAMAESARARTFTLRPPTLLPPAMLAGARYVSAAAALLLIGVVSYDVASNVMPSATASVAGEATANRAFEQMDRAFKAAPQLAPAAAPAPSQSAPGAPGGGAGGSAESAGGNAEGPEQPPEETLLAPPVAPGSSPSTASEPDAGSRSSAPTAQEDPAADTLADTTMRAQTDEFGYAPADRLHPSVPSLIRWLEAALATLLASAGVVWWWGRRPG